MLDRCAADGIAAGYPLAREYPEHEDGLLVAITERHGRAQIERLAPALESALAPPPVATHARTNGAPLAEGAAR